jgi:hypothetical protein
MVTTAAIIITWSIIIIVLGGIGFMIFKNRKFNRKWKHKWKPVGHFLSNGKVYVIEFEEEKGIYRYVQVPSYSQLEEMERRE